MTVIHYQIIDHFQAMSSLERVCRMEWPKPRRIQTVSRTREASLQMEQTLLDSLACMTLALGTRNTHLDLESFQKNP